MVHIINKMITNLLDNVGKYKTAMDDQLKTTLRNADKDYILNYKKELLDKLIAIIFEKFKAKKAEDLVVRHGIILKSLKIIAHYNNIDHTYIEKKYREGFKGMSESIVLDQIVAASKKDIPTYGMLKIPNCPNRKEFFEHIINVIYDPENTTYNDHNIDILIKLSKSFSVSVVGGDLFDDSCEKTINEILKEKGYLISEAYILGEGLQEKINKVIFYDLSESEYIKKATEINEEAKSYYVIIAEYINGNNDGLYKDQKYRDTSNAILKIYTKIKKMFNSKFDGHNKVKGIELLNDIVAKTVKNR